MTTVTTLPGFTGELIGPDDAVYDEARKVHNGRIDKRPALIARCTGPTDVETALLHARDHDLVVAVRGGGHSTSGFSSCDGGLVIDTGPMKSAAIDPVGRTGRFGAGLIWRELDALTQEHGLAVTGGRMSTTGVAGLTLGSGSGWLERVCGATAANLISARLVTADGRTVRAAADENADLLWGIRGGGGNFGVVTDFEFRLHPVGPILYAGMILHPRAAAKALARFYRGFMEQAPDEVNGAVALLTAPPAEFVPEAVRGLPACGLVVVYVGDPGEGEAVLRPLLEWGEPWASMVQPMPYTALQTMLDPSMPKGIREYFKVDYLPDLPDDAIEALVDKADQISSPFTDLILCPMGGALARMDRRALALSTPDAGWYYFCLPKWWDPGEDDLHVAWARSLMETMRPWSVGTAPSNFISLDEGAARVRASFGPEKFDRLVALKDKYDPDNIFALNQNIPPSAP